MKTQEENTGEIVRENFTEQYSNTSAPEQTYFSDDEIAEFRSNIENKKEKATKELQYLQSFTSLPDNEKKVVPPGVTDPINAWEKDQLDQMVTRQETFIDHLNEALQRIENKTYGICRFTGKPIDKARLLAVPHATLSLEAKLGQDTKTNAAAIEEKPKKKSSSKKQKAPANAVRYSDEDLRNFKTLISNKIDSANEKLKYFRIVKYDREKGIKVEGYEELSVAEAQALIDRQKSFIAELESALDRVKKKTYGVCEETGELIPKEMLLQHLIIKRLKPTPERPSSTIENKTEEVKVRTCRICGCTEENCSQCIEKTGEPCYWIEEDLCSACEEEAMNEKGLVQTGVISDQQLKPAIEDIEPLSSSVDDEPLIINQGNAPIELSDAEKKHLAELENNQSTNDNIMNFFQQLAQAGAQKVDLTMRIMQKENKLTVNIIPGVKSNTIKPLLITGTPQELDDGFFKTMSPVITEITGLVTNAEEVKKDLQQKKTTAASAPPKKEKHSSGSHKQAPKKAAKKEGVKKAEKKKPEVKEQTPVDAEPNMFG